MLHKTITITTLACSILLTGCATPTKMAFSDGEPKPTMEKPIYLMTATLKNSYNNSYQPNLKIVHVEKGAAKNSEEKINFLVSNNDMESASGQNKDQTYLLHMELANGQYTIRGLSSTSGLFPVIGSFFTPIHANLAAAKPGIYYLGHINATVRERVGDEFKAGSSIPLIDQAVVGASTGTFDIVISDNWQNDENKFRTKFPLLSNATILKSILPPFDRQTAQKWWESH